MQFTTHDYQVIKPAIPHVVTPDSFCSMDSKRSGSILWALDLEKCKEILEHRPPIYFPDKNHSYPSAAQMVQSKHMHAFEKKRFRRRCLFRSRLP